MPPFLDPLERLLLIRDGFYSPDARLHTQAAALLALDRGLPLRDVARSVRCDPDTLYRWRDRYLENRDLAALRDARSRHAARRTTRLRPARTAAVLALAEHHPGPDARRLGLDDDARARLAAAAADPKSTPARRHWAALLLAYDRGVPVTHIARATACSRRTIYEAPARHLPAILNAP